MDNNFKDEKQQIDESKYIVKKPEWDRNQSGSDGYSNISGMYSQQASKQDAGGQQNLNGAQGQSPYGGQNPGVRPNPYGAQSQNPYGTTQNPYGGQNPGVRPNPYGAQSQSPYGSAQNPYGSQRPNPYGTQSPYGDQNQGSEYYPRPMYASQWDMQERQRKEKRSLIIALSCVFGIFFLIIGLFIGIKAIIDVRAGANASELELSIEDIYGVEIRVKHDADVTELGFNIESYEADKGIENALEAIQEVLERLPEDFLEEVMEGYRHGRYLEINVTGDMIADGRDIVGLTTYEENKDVIRVTASVYSWDQFKATFAHELFHVIDFEMNQFDMNDSVYSKWKNHNPRGFTYSKDEGMDSQYTYAGEYDLSEVYFVSEYSKESISEDRAELFSWLLSTDEGSRLSDSYASNHVRSKAELLYEELRSNFSSVVGEEVYWEQWYN